jgi:uncharacterized protein YrrD
MKYDSELYDLPVVDRLTGGLLGYMRGIVCQPGARQLEGIVFEDRSWIRHCHFVPWLSVSVIGNKSIVVDGNGRSRASKNTVSPGRDSKVFNGEGGYVGRISNYLIDEKTGAVVGMELSESLMDDLKFGRKIIENRGNILRGEQFLMIVNHEDSGAAGQSERRSDDEGLY